MPKVMTIRPPESLRKILKNYCEKKGYTVNQIVLQILWEWVDKNHIERK